MSLLSLLYSYYYYLYMQVTSRLLGHKLFFEQDQSNVVYMNKQVSTENVIKENILSKVQHLNKE